MEPAPGQLLAGKLEVIRRLGAGGVGTVWEVEHTLTRHHRALKLLHARFLDRPEVVERFLREASAAGRIGNAHIVETFDAGKLDTGEPYLLMELLEGEPFSARVRLGAMDPATVAWTVRQACLGVAAAHDALIVHRDLKPDNLFVCTGPDGRPFVKVLDFGISHFDEPGSPRLTQEGVTLGTPLYMSPEQISGQADVDRRTDVYALGVILYEAVSGRPPFEGVSLAALAVQIHRGQPTRLSQLRADLPPGFAEVVEKAMHVDRAQRYPGARELYEALAPFEAVPGALDVTALPGIGVPTAPARPFPGDTAPVRTAPDAAPPTGRRGSIFLFVALAIALGGVVWSYFPRGSGDPPPARPDPSKPLPKPTEVAPVVVPAPPEPQPTLAVADAGTPKPRPPRKQSVLIEKVPDELKDER